MMMNLMNHITYCTMQKYLNRIKRAALPLCALILLWGCSSDSVDVSPPTINLLDHNPAPVPAIICGQQEDTVFHLKGGDSLYFNIRFEDDVALSSYKVDIHNNFDCHGHGEGATPGFSPPNQEGLTEDWSVLDIRSLQGLRAQEERWLVVPEAVTAGNYHYHIQVLDESGNDSPFTTFYSLKLLNPSDTVPPNLSLEIPVETTFSASKGALFRIAGQVSDNLPLADGGNGLLFVTYTDLSSGNSFATKTVEPFDTDMGNQFDFDLEVEIPKTLPVGDYRFTVRAHDGVRNMAEPIDLLINVTN